MAQPGFPTTAEAITSAWLTKVLRAEGVLSLSGKVVDFDECAPGRWDRVHERASAPDVPLLRRHRRSASHGYRQAARP